MTDNPYDSPQTTETTAASGKKLSRRLIVWTLSIGIIGCLIVLALPIRRGPSIQVARRMHCRNQMKQLTLGLHYYHDEYETFPPAFTVDENGNRLHSWRTLILPYIEHQELYDSIDLTKPWDDPANQVAFNSAPDFYRCPSADIPENHTVYMAVVHEDACFHPEPSKNRKFIDIIMDSDGYPGPLLLIETSTEHAVHWMEPSDADEQIIAKSVIGRSNSASQRC